MIILGIANSKDSGACLMVDGRLVSAINEERLSRKKLTKEFPYRSIEWILKQHSLSINDVDVLGTGVWKGMDSWNMLPTYFSEAMECVGAEPSTQAILQERLASSVATDSQQYREMVKGIADIGAAEKPLYRCNHHYAHALTGFYFSPFENALVVTLDGRGDFCSGSVSQMSRNVLPKLLRLETEFNSLGVFYGWVTKYLGFTPDRHEGKVTGLAAAGDPDRCRPILQKMISTDEGRIRAQLGPYYRPYACAPLPDLDAELRGYSKEDVAAAAQGILEDIVVRYVRHYMRLTGEKNLCLSGGIYANVLLNMRLKDMPEVEGLFVYPHMGDGGIAAGGAAYAALKLGASIQPIHSAYLGPEFSAEFCEAEISRRGLVPNRVEHFAEYVATELHKGRIVGFFNGRMEYGPRALGARSIMVRPTDVGINQSLNARLNRTEFMPFAPVTLEEAAAERYVGWKSDQINPHFMTACYACTDIMKKEAPAVVHIDGTARPQIISRERNGAYYDVLKAYSEISGIPTLINTSFNRHEEPIICTPGEALDEYMAGSIDVLAMHPFVLSRKD